MRHAVIDVAIKLSRFALLHHELDHLETVASVDSPVVTLHPKVAEYERGTLFQKDMVETLKIEFVERWLFNHEGQTPIIVLLRQISDEQRKFFAEAGR